MAKEILLAIESSASRASVALGCVASDAVGTELIFEAEVDAGRRQSEVLIGPVQEAVDALGDEPLAVVVVGTGPGSYNGARVGIACGQGIALVHDCPVVGVTSLEALGPVRSMDPCLALGDARRGTFFTASLRDGELSADPDLLDHERFVKKAAEAAAHAHLLTLEEPSRLRLPEDLAGQVQQVAPSAPLLLDAWVAMKADRRAVLLQTPPQPFYLRPPHITKPGPRA